jgi:hypothetical protein
MLLLWEGCWNVGRRPVVSGTLLGPEGSGASSGAFCSGLTCWPYRLISCVGGVVGGLVVVGFRPYFENYTVDASIFVAKFLRAHGGCLGTRNRRRT